MICRLRVNQATQTIVIGDNILVKTESICVQSSVKVCVNYRSINYI